MGFDQKLSKLTKMTHFGKKLFKMNHFGKKLTKLVNFLRFDVFLSKKTKKCTKIAVFVIFVHFVHKIVILVDGFWESGIITFCDLYWWIFGNKIVQFFLIPKFHFVRGWNSMAARAFVFQYIWCNPDRRSLHGAKFGIPMADFLEVRIGDFENFETPSQNISKSITGWPISVQNYLFWQGRGATLAPALRALGPLTFARFASALYINIYISRPIGVRQSNRKEDDPSGPGSVNWHGGMAMWTFFASLVNLM